MKKKIGLAVIYDPHNLYQFLWYYCTYGKDIEWYALCLPNSYKGEYLSKSCESLGIFTHVYTDDKPFDALPLGSKIKLFVRMFFYAIFGQQKRFFKKFIANYISNLSFDIAVVLTDVGFISGMFLLEGKEKEIVILEDGMSDYFDKRYSNIFSHMNNFFDVQGFILSVLGYSNTGHHFPLRTTKNCVKFCTHSDMMKYKKYKEIKLLFDLSETNLKLFYSLIEHLYPDLSNYFKNNVECILFTCPLTDFVSDDSKYINLVEDYISKNYKSVLLKRHPRDKSEYDFGKNVAVTEIVQSIPAEVLLPYLNGIDILFCGNSSTNLYMSAFNYKPLFFYFMDLKKDNESENNILGTYLSYDDFVTTVEGFGMKNTIIKLSF